MSRNRFYDFLADLGSRSFSRVYTNIERSRYQRTDSAAGPSRAGVDERNVADVRLAFGHVHSGTAVVHSLHTDRTRARLELTAEPDSNSMPSDAAAR